MKNCFAILLLILFISCSKSSNINYSFDNILSYKDTLFIKSRFADCGEWGGHNEIIKIYFEKEKTKLTYTKYKVDCGIRDNKVSIVQNEEVKKRLFYQLLRKMA